MADENLPDDEMEFIKDYRALDEQGKRVLRAALADPNFERLADALTPEQLMAHYRLS